MVTCAISDLRFQTSFHPPALLLPGTLQQVPGNSLWFLSLKVIEMLQSHIYIVIFLFFVSLEFHQFKTHFSQQMGKLKHSEIKIMNINLAHSNNNNR